MTSENTEKDKEKKKEYLLFFTLTFLIIPGFTIAFVGAYGFLVWIYQIVVGPPGS